MDVSPLVRHDDIPDHTALSENLASASVSVVIPCYNHAHFLAEAVSSVETQSVRPSEVIVIDDGSTDNTGAVAQGLADVTYYRQENSGLSCARNAGLERAHGEFIVFLDADDILLPDAIERGLECFEHNPQSAFVYGGHLGTDVDGNVLWETKVYPCDASYSGLLRANVIGMHAAVMYRRDILKRMGGFDKNLRYCEDYDVYLRIAAQHPIACHAGVIAEYRQHGANMSHNAERMLRTTLEVLEKHGSSANADPETHLACESGLRHYQKHYGGPMLVQSLKHLSRGEFVAGSKKLASVKRLAPQALWGAPKSLTPLVRQRLKRAAPPWILRMGGRIRGKAVTPPVGQVNFGDLRRVSPIDPDFGHQRGKAVDRHYVEEFLSGNQHDISGRVLEIGDDEYTRKYGDMRVSQSDILNLKPGNPKTTIVADLSSAGHIPDDTFDCIIFTQTLQFIFDLQSTIATLTRILKPNGVLLLTVPGITQIDRGEWRETWHWSFTSESVTRLFTDAFSGNIKVETHGNVLVATAFLHGLAAHELTEAELAACDPAYQVLITMRAVKPES